MKHLILLFFSVSATFLTNAQKEKLTYSNKEKLEVRAYGLHILGSTSKNLYFTEKKDNLLAYFSSGGGVQPKISKFDEKTLTLAEEKEYKKVIRGYTFLSFQFLQERIFLFCTKSRNREKTYSLYGCEIDKESLEPLSELKEIASIDLEEKTESPSLNIFPSTDSSNLIFIGSPNEQKNALRFSVIDLHLKTIINSTVSLPGNKESFRLKDIQYSKNGQLLILAKEFINETPDKKKSTYIFKTSVLYAFNHKGEKLFAITDENTGNHLFSSRIKETSNNQLLFGGLFSTDSKKAAIAGAAFKIINLTNGKIIQQSTGLFSNNKNYQNAETGNVIKDLITNNESFVLNDLEISPDNKSVILIAESYSTQYTTRQEKSAGGTPRTVEKTNIHYQELLLMNLAPGGSFNWINVLPKYQNEVIMARSPMQMKSVWENGDYCYETNSAFYGSFHAIFKKNGIQLFFNDNEKNTQVLSLQQKPHTLSGAINLRPYLLNCDYKTGKIDRKELEEDKDDTVALFSKGFFIGGNFYFPTRAHSGLDALPFSYKIGKITLQ